MRVFISWSGEESKAVAEALHSCLKQIIQVLDVWISSRDIEVGAPWFPEIYRNLEQSNIGIVCLTPTNVNKPWVLFEAGALAKQVSTAEDRARMIPYLFKMAKVDVTGPLGQFQATEADKEGTRQVIRMINGHMGPHARPQKDLDDAFEMWWPLLERTLQSIPPSSPRAERPQRTVDDVLGEILMLAREADAARNTLASQPPCPYQHLIEGQGPTVLVLEKGRLVRKPVAAWIPQVESPPRAVRQLATQALDDDSEVPEGPADDAEDGPEKDRRKR
jgi:hypothetical protein